ncbi:hypothetical protein [Azospirillum largimobile]
MARGHKRRTLEAGHMTAPARIANRTDFPCTAAVVHT